MTTGSLNESFTANLRTVHAPLGGGGGQMKSYKDTIKANMKTFDIPAADLGVPCPGQELLAY